MIIRPLDPDRELESYLRVVRQNDSSPLTPAAWQERQQRAAPHEFRRFLVGELDGEIIATAAVLDHQYLTNGVVARLVVDPGHRGRGHGRAMEAAVERLLAERQPSAVDVRVMNDDQASQEWAERRGFRPRHRMIRSRIDLAAFDSARHRFAVEGVQAAGLRLEIATDGDRLYDLYAKLVVDTPDQLEAPSRESFQREMETRPEVMRLVAADRQAWAGLALVGPSGTDGAWNDFTGVLPEYRGRGIARALKVATIEEMRRQGRSWIETANNDGNAPMLAVNRALGYRPVATVQFLRRVR